MRNLALLAAVSVLIGSPRLAAAQIPGDELPQISRVRNQFLQTTYNEVKERLADWEQFQHENDVDQLRSMFTRDGFYSPVEGWFVEGREALADTLAQRMPRVKGYHASVLDFTASGSLAYCSGRLSYLLDEPGAARQVSGMFVMVLYQEGRTWRVRSYVERDGD